MWEKVLFMENDANSWIIKLSGRRSALMVSALDSGSNGPGWSTGQSHFVVFLGKTLYSHSVSLDAGV